MLLRLAVFAAVATATSSIALAQSTPNFSYGQVPTAGQWNAAFASKQDRLTFTPLNQAGGTMQGKLYTAPATVNGAGFSILPGIAPSAPANGDIWATGSGLFAQINNQTVTLSSAAALGTMASQNANSVAITGGSINGTTIGATTPSSGAFTTLTATTPLGLTSGGTGGSTASGARSNLGAAASGANTDITSLGPVILGNGATATTQAANDNSTKAATTAYVTTAVTAGDQSATTTFTPTITAASGTLTTASAAGRYRRIGSKLVWVSYSATITTNGTGSGNIILTLPFTASAQNNIISGRENAATGKMLQGVTQPNTSNLFVFNYDNSYPAANGYQIVVSGVYEAQ